MLQLFEIQYTERPLLIKNYSILRMIKPNAKSNNQYLYCLTKLTIFYMSKIGKQFLSKNRNEQIAQQTPQSCYEDLSYLSFCSKRQVVLRGMRNVARQYRTPKIINNEINISLKKQLSAAKYCTMIRTYMNLSNQLNWYNFIQIIISSHSSLQNNLMESQTYLEKFSQSTYRQNLLDAKAETSIKRHQVKGFINAGEGVSKITMVENDENSQLAQHLMQLKTSCSGVRLDIKHKQLEQFKYKDETHFVADKVKAIHDQRFQLDTEIQKLKSVVEEVKEKKVTATLSTKSYEHILDRMKKDQIRGQIRRNQLEKELKKLEKSHKELSNKCYELKQFQYLSANGVKQAEEEIKELNSFRKSTVADMSTILQEKQVLQKKKQDRKQKSDMIKQMAAGDLQDADLIRMKKFLTVQVFLKAMLKSKMQKLKQFYSPYELAFLKIKGNTSVKDANSLKSEYHNFEVSYNERSIWVKHLEDEITVLQGEKKQLEKSYQVQKLKQLEILQSLEVAGNHSQSLVDKQLQAKANQCEITVMSVKQWLKQQAKRMNMESSNKLDPILLKQICQELKKKKIQKV